MDGSAILQEELERLVSLAGVKARIIENPVTGIVATAATEVFRNNPRRLSWLAVNLSANYGRIVFDRTLSPGYGVVVGPNGGYASMNVLEDGSAVIYPVHASNEISSGTWYFVEIERV